jgi:hypothetical protein
MGHQTNYNVCKKCKGITITTQLSLSNKKIISSNCKCKKNESNNR